MADPSAAETSDSQEPGPHAQSPVSGLHVPSGLGSQVGVAQNGRAVPRQKPEAGEPPDHQPKHRGGALSAGLLLAPVLLAISAGAAEAGWHMVRSRTEPHWGPAAFIVAGFFLLMAFAVPIALFHEGAVRADEDSRCEHDCRILDVALSGIGDHTLSGLARANFRQMRMFTNVALRQARMSFYASLVAASLSLLVLLSGGAVASGLAGSGAQIAAASVTAVGAALSGFLTATFLKTYRITTRQMSYYYGQPLVHCYLLHAEWITLMLTNHPDRSDEADQWRRVAEASLRASENAQNHLLMLRNDATDLERPWQRRHNAGRS